VGAALRCAARTRNATRHESLQGLEQDASCCAALRARLWMQQGFTHASTMRHSMSHAMQAAMPGAAIPVPPATAGAPCTQVLLCRVALGRDVPVSSPLILRQTST